MAAVVVAEQRTFAAVAAAGGGPDGLCMRAFPFFLFVLIFGCKSFV